MAQLRPDLPAELDRIIGRALEKDRDLRYQHASEMRAELQRLTRKTQSSASVATQEATNKSLQHRNRLLIAALCIAAVGLIAIGALYSRFRPRTPVVTAIHQLTRTGRPKFLSYGIHQVATDGTRLYFNDPNPAADGVSSIAQISTKGGEVSYLQIPLVRYPELLGSTPDGSDLLVIDLYADQLAGSIWLASLPNGPQRRIGNIAAALAALVPGSRRLVYSQPPNLKQLHSLDTSGADPRVLLDAPHEIGVFSLSPDGERIRFEMADELWEALLDGTGLHRFLPQYKGSMCCGAWSPDGSLYSFARTEEGVNNLWAVSETGWLRWPRVSPPVQLTYGPVSFSTPTFSKDGKQIFALGLIQRGELEVYDNASHQFQPYMNGLSAAYLGFSPDGQWVAYVAYPQKTLWRSRIDGTDRLQLTFPPMGPIVNPKWSPDGRSIAFIEWGGVDKKIYVTSANGGDPQLLLSGSFNPADPPGRPMASPSPIVACQLWMDRAPRSGF